MSRCLVTRWICVVPRIGRKCAGCEARQQTIRLLADMIDWHRSQMSQHSQSMSMAAEPPRFKSPERKHTLDEEEDVLAAMEAGAMTTDEAERALAAIQAFNTEIEVDRPAGGVRWQ